MNDRDRKDLFTVEDPFEDEQAPAPAIAADAPGARQAAEAPFCEPGLDAVIASAFDRMGPSAAAEERMLAALIATCGDGAAAADLARRGPVERTGAVRGARRLRAGKVLLPAAACLVLLAGVGALAYQGLVAAQLNGSLQGAAGSGTASSSGELASISDSAASEDLGSASDGAANGAPEASRDDPFFGGAAVTTGGPPGAPAPPRADGSAGAPPSGGSAEAPSSDGSVNESSSGDSTGAGARCPLVTLASGQVLHIATDEAGQPLAANPALVGAAIEQATASDGAGGPAVTCTVFASASDAHPYAVRYPGDAACYWADEAA